jgi:HEPN domain-containing protein
VPIALLNRDKLRQLCNSRLEEAAVLLEKNFWTGAYYFAGLGVECALKSCLASTVRQYDFPEKSFVNQIYVHDLELLLKLNPALWSELRTEIKINTKLALNWNIIRRWSDGKRYELVEESVAKSLYEAATETNSGIVEWIRRRW